MFHNRYGKTNVRILLTCFLRRSFNEFRFRANKYPEMAKNIQLAIRQIPNPIKRCRYGANGYCAASLKLLCKNTTIITSMVFNTMILSLRYRVIKCIESCEGFPNQNNADLVTAQVIGIWSFAWFGGFH